MIPDVIVARRSALKIKDEELAKGILFYLFDTRLVYFGNLYLICFFKYLIRLIHYLTRLT
jgi:hypothetical protein